MGRLLRFIRAGIPRIHPPMEDLVDWADGCAQPGTGTGRHLSRCADCRAQVLLIQRACQAARAHANGAGEWSALSMVFERLQTRMHGWPGNRQSRNPAHARLTRAIELYFGREAASRLMKESGGSEPERRLVQAVKPMFSAFLGTAAADALAEHIAGAEC